MSASSTGFAQIKRALHYISDMKKTVFTAQAIMILATLSEGAIPLLMGSLFNRDKKLLPVLGLMFFLFVTGGVMNYWKDVITGRIGNQITVSLRNDVYRKLEFLPLDFFVKNSTGDLMSKIINDINMFQMALSSGVLYLLQMFLSLIVTVGILLFCDPLLTAVLFLTFPLMILINKLHTRSIETISRSNQENLADISDILNQSISGIEVIKSFSLQKTAAQLFSQSNQNWFHSSGKLIRIKSKNSFWIHLATALQLILLIGIGFYRVESGALSLGAFTSFLLYAQMLNGPIGMLSSLYVDVQSAFASMKRIFDIIDLEEEPDLAGGCLSAVQGDIVFQNVSFSYEEGKPVLENLSFHIRPGQTAAFVGPSGAGKSTILKLLQGFLHPDSGEIFLDGVNIREISISSLRGSIASVSQSPFLFGLSIRENIACGDVSADDGRIVRSAQLANAYHFIQNTSHGFDTVVGEGGGSLSGGQKQRIAIARAFLKNAPILLLDEATSSLDNRSEQEVQSALEHLSQNRTTLIVAHRLTTIVHADVIFYLDGGMVQAYGSHSDLLQSCHPYRELFSRCA